jgi:glutaredoxin
MKSTRLALYAGMLMLVSGCAASPEPVQTTKAAAAEDTPAALEAEMRKVPVAMYMTEWCPYCMRARDWLREGNYRFVEHDIERDDRAAAVLFALNPRGSVPMFDVDGQIVIGFEPRELHTAIMHAARSNRSGGGWGEAAPQ